MSTKHDPVKKQTVISRYKSGEPISHIVQDTGIPRSTIYNWLKLSKAAENNRKEPTPQNFQLLEKKVKRLEGLIEILKTVDCSPKDPLKVKLDALEKLQQQHTYSVHMICEALEVPRGTFYNHILRNKRENTSYVEHRAKLREVIQRIYDESNQIFGYKKIFAIMKEQGHHTSPEMVQNLMREMGLKSIRQGAKSTYKKEQRKFNNHVNQQFTVTRPDEVWVSDVTYFRFDDKKFYICAVIDLFARKVIAYRIGKSNSTQLVKATFRAAYENRCPSQSLVFHTDRGTNYRSNSFCAYLKSLGVTQSFSKAYTLYDNSVMESFFSSLKLEELYRSKYRSENEFRAAVDKYMIFYNEQRPHDTNQNKTPARKEKKFYRDCKEKSVVSS